MPNHEDLSLFEMPDQVQFDPTPIAAQAQARYEASRDAGDIQPASTIISPAERLHIMHDIEGFYPTNNHELTRSFAIKDFRQTPVGAAGYLNEILLHQRKTTKAEDPTAALKSVVNEMAGYASKARIDITSLRGFQQELNDHGAANNLVAIKRVGPVTGVGQFVRQHDLALLASKGPAALPFNPLKALTTRNAYDAYTASQPSPAVRDRIDVVLSTVRLWEAQEVVADMVEEQSKRFKFWTENLIDSKRHSAARGAAHTALTALGVTPPR